MTTQRAFARNEREHPDRAMRIRIGLHSGSVIVEPGDFIGRNVIVASRIADSARGGEVLVSREMRRHVSGEPGLRWGPPRTLELRGLSEPRTVYAATDPQPARASEQLACVLPAGHPSCRA